MRAIICEDDKLHFSEVENPKAQKDEVLLNVQAIGVNHADLLQRRGKYPPPPGASSLLGLEVAGTIEGTNERVMALLSGGGYAEKVAVRKSHCLPIPENLSFEEAAAIPETFLTAYQALFQIGELQPDQWVLIHAGGSGVGTSAIQLARIGGGHTITTTRSQEKIEECLSLGADAVLNAKSGAFAQKVREVTQDHGVDLIIDFVGVPYFDENLEALAMGGALVFLATLGGNHVLDFDLRLLMKKWATLTGTTLRNRPPEYKTKLIEEFGDFALSRFASKELKPIIHEILPWSEVEKAHLTLIQNKAFGKIVLTLS